MSSAHDERVFLTLQESQPPYFVGVDLGGTSIKIGLVDNLGRPMAWMSIPTEVPLGGEAATVRMAEAVVSLLNEVGLKKTDVARVGLGSPGPMDIPAGMLLKPVNLKGWNDFHIRDRLAANLGLPVTFENDANAAAYGEFWVGSGAEFPSMVMFTLGTGVGGGIVLGDHIVQGHNSHGGELGHICIDFNPDARVCSCNRRGHLEAYASATGLVHRTRDALKKNPTTTLTKRLSAGEELTPLMMAEEAEAGDQFCTDLIMETAHFLGLGVITVLSFVDPAAIVIGGAMTFGRDETALGRAFKQKVKQTAVDLAFSILGDRIEIRFAQLGGDAGYIGAAGCARVEWLKTQK